jgi:hypothetical protein
MSFPFEKGAAFRILTHAPFGTFSGRRREARRFAAPAAGPLPVRPGAPGSDKMTESSIFYSGIFLKFVLT